MRTNKVLDSVLITAFGAVTPIGSQYEEIEKSLKFGLSGIKKNEKFNCESYITEHAGIPDEGNAHIRWPNNNRITGEMFYADLSAERLKAHPAFPHHYYDSERIGCIIGVDEPAIDIQLALKINKNTKSNSQEECRIKHFIDTLRLSDCFNFEPSMVLNKIYKNIPFGGYSMCHVGLCSASLQAIGMGMNAIQNDLADAMIVGGVSGKVTPINLARLEKMDVISTDTNLLPEERSRPFDSKRSGFMLAEGAILFMLEKSSNVKRRGAKGLLEVSGYGSSLGAQHIVIPHKDSLEMELSMRRAINDAGLTENDIDHINAHGTSTVLNDLHESLAINRIFSDNKKITVTANKSLHGHLIAAAGAMEVLNVLVYVNQGFIPATTNLYSQDPQCVLNVVKKIKEQKINTVLKNSFGMGGLAASLVLKRCERNYAE